MIVSCNEVENLVYKAAEGAGFWEGFCVSNMRAVSYLETIDQKGVKFFLQFLKNPPLQKIPNISTKKDSITIDFSQTSCLYYLENLAALILTKTQNKIILENIENTIFLLPFLLGNNLQITIKKSKQNINLLLTEKENYPEIIYTKNKSNLVQELTTIEKNNFLLNNITGTYKRITSTELAENCKKKEILLEKNDWQTLLKLSSKVLVQDTEQSQQGAGENQNFLDPEDIFM